MKRILIILIIGFVFVTVQAQMDNPLKKGMPNTVTLSTGDVVYDLNGEWDAVYDSVVYLFAGGQDRETKKDIVKITQEGNQFVGIKLVGDEIVGKNQETVKGELEKNGFRKVYIVIWDTNVLRASWAPSKAEISEDGNKIVVKCHPNNWQKNMIVLNRK